MKSIVLRRIIYMAVAIVTAVSLFYTPVFSFLSDTGIIYTRSFSMDNYMFYVTQTHLESGKTEITDSMSVAPLQYCRWAILVGCIGCLVCFWTTKGRLLCISFCLLSTGAFYVLAIYYAVQIVDNFYTTLYPSVSIILPAIIIQIMLQLRKDILDRLNNDENPEN